MSSESSARAGAARRHVLIVEDDELMYAFYKAMFRRYKDEFDCCFVKSGEEAVERLRSRPPEAMLLDWDLPGIDGLTVLKALRSHPKTKGTRVLLVSARTTAEDEVKAFESGADDYLSKPFQVEILLARLRGLLRR